MVGRDPRSVPRRGTVAAMTLVLTAAVLGFLGFRLAGAA